MSKWICDRGRSIDMRLYPDCTWEGGEKCSAIKEHSHDKHCEGGFCMRAGVHRQCHEIIPVSKEDRLVADEFIRLADLRKKKLSQATREE